jgi:hypothetical protein
MRALLAPIVLFLGCAHASSTTAEVVHTPTLSESFREVELDGAFDVEILVGSPPSVKMTGDEAAVDHVEVEVKEERLYLSMEDRRPLDGKVHIVITTPVLESLEINGAVDLELSGLKSGELEMELNGAGVTWAQGAVDALDLEINGAGEIDASELVASTVEVEISGAGKAKVNARKELDATLSGVGSVRYAGDPEVVEKDVSGVGTIRPL